MCIIRGLMSHMCHLILMQLECVPSITKHSKLKGWVQKRYKSTSVSKRDKHWNSCHGYRPSCGTNSKPAFLTVSRIFTIVFPTRPSRGVDWYQKQYNSSHVQVVAIVRKMAESDILCVGAEVTVHSRKRKCNPANWARNMKRKKKALGLEYTRSDGSLALPRKTGQPCNCRKKCFTRFSDTEKQQIIDDFNGLGRK